MFHFFWGGAGNIWGWWNFLGGCWIFFGGCWRAFGGCIPPPPVHPPCSLLFLVFIQIKAHNLLILNHLKFAYLKNLKIFWMKSLNAYKEVKEIIFLRKKSVMSYYLLTFSLILQNLYWKWKKNTDLMYLYSSSFLKIMFVLTISFKHSIFCLGHN